MLSLVSRLRHKRLVLANFSRLFSENGKKAGDENKDELVDRMYEVMKSMPDIGKEPEPESLNLSGLLAKSKAVQKTDGEFIDATVLQEFLIMVAKHDLNTVALEKEIQNLNTDPKEPKIKLASSSLDIISKYFRPSLIDKS